MKSFCLICFLVSVSWNPRQIFLPDFACLSINTSDKSPKLFVCLTIYENAETCPPRDRSCRQLCSFPFFRPSNLGYSGRGVLLNRENHPPFTCLDPADTSSTSRSPTVGARPRAHEAHRVGDHARSPFFDPQNCDIVGKGYCWTGRNTLPLPVLTLQSHPLTQDLHS